jgi:hypothetical protein
LFSQTEGRIKFAIGFISKPFYVGYTFVNVSWAMGVRLPTEDLYALGKGDMTSCDWDLSDIPAQEYEPFFLGLGNVLYKKVVKARFSVDCLREVVASASVGDSIAAKVHRYRRRLLKVFKRVLPQTKTLTSLIVDGIVFPAAEISRLLQTAAQSPRLTSLILANFEVPATAFRQFLGSTSPASFKEIVFQNCGLSDAAAEDAIGFLRATPRGKWTLRSLRLPDNHIGGETLAQIDDLVRRRGAVDLRDAEEEEAALSEGAVAPLAAHSIGARVDNVPEAEPSDDPFVENQNLRDELAALLGAAGAVRYNDDVFLVGPSASADLRIIQKCERLVREDETDEQ